MGNKGFKAYLRTLVSEGRKKVTEYNNAIRYYEEISTDTEKYGSQKREEAKQKVSELKRDRELIISEIKTGIAEEFDKHINEINADFALKPEELTGDAELLKGYDLTAFDLRAIKERNKDNHTIRRLVSNYALNHGISDREKGDNTDLIDYSYLEQNAQIHNVEALKASYNAYLWKYAEDCESETGRFQYMFDTIMKSTEEGLPD